MILKQILILIWEALGLFFGLFGDVFFDAFRRGPGSAFLSIAAPFLGQSLFLFSPFLGLVELVKIDAPLARKHTFRGLRRPRYRIFSPTFSDIDF